MAATEAVRQVAAYLVESVRWVNMDPNEDARLESRVTQEGLAVLLLQRDPEHKRAWLPVASWGRCLDTGEKFESKVMLELKALREGSWKLSEYTAFHQRLTYVISKELRALLKIAPKAHPQLQALLIDVLQYKPTWVVDARTASPKQLGFQDHSSDVP